MLNVYVSFPKDNPPKNAAAWTAAISKRVGAAFPVIAIVDYIEGRYQLRSAHSAGDGQVSDLTPDAQRFLQAAGLL